MHTYTHIHINTLDMLVAQFFRCILQNERLNGVMLYWLQMIEHTVEQNKELILLGQSNDGWPRYFILSISLSHHSNQALVRLILLPHPKLLLNISHHSNQALVSQS